MWIGRHPKCDFSATPNNAVFASNPCKADTQRLLPSTPTQTMIKQEGWGEVVTLVFADMRMWEPPEKTDILVSELLGSFGDNELSPECLDGAQRLLKLDGISIPQSYTSFMVRGRGGYTLDFENQMYGKAGKDWVFPSAHAVPLQAPCPLPLMPLCSFPQPPCSRPPCPPVPSRPPSPPTSCTMMSRTTRTSTTLRHPTLSNSTGRPGAGRAGGRQAERGGDTAHGGGGAEGGIRVQAMKSCLLSPSLPLLSGMPD